MHFEDIQSIAGCVMAACQTDCESRAAMDQWSSNLCAATAAPKPIDGDAGGAGGPDGGRPLVSAAGATGAGATAGSSGCATAAGQSAGREPAGFAFVLLGATWLARRRRSRSRA
jgi:MYXO-CTERM domain-containing protein